MLLRQIQYFQAVVEENSFTEAGERCHISQSAISQQIQALETELGVQLLERHRRKFIVTPAGEHFYKKSLVLTADLEQLCRDTIRVARSDASQLNIGYLKSYTGEELHRAIALFSAEHPEAELHITDGNHEELFDGLRLGKLDLVLNDQRRAFSDAYVNRILSESRCHVEIATHNPLSRLDAIEVSDLKNTPCILVSSPEQQENERGYYRDVVGFRGEFRFAATLQEARVMVVANQGVMPIELRGYEPYFGSAMRRVPLLQNGEPIVHRLCAFRKKENNAPLLEAFERTLAEQFK